MNTTRIAVLSAILAVVPGCEKFGGTQQGTQTQLPNAPEPSARTVRAPIARYQIVFSPHVRADTFLLDTQKGRVWQMTKFSDLPGAPTAWNEVDIIDSTGEIGMKFSDFLQQNSPQRPPERKSKKQ